MNRSKGVTYIELMAIIAILSVLLLVAISAYQDYQVRSKVTEAMGYAGEAKTAVADYYYNIRDWPTDNADAGLSPASNFSRYAFIRELSLTSTPRPGTISIVFDIPGSTADGRELYLIPSTLTDIITWSCDTPGDNALDINHLPASCRDD